MSEFPSILILKYVIQYDSYYMHVCESIKILNWSVNFRAKWHFHWIFRPFQGPKCASEIADSECWGVLCQPQPGLLVTLHFYNPVAVAEWTKCMGMVTPVIGSSLHLGSWQYDVINRLYVISNQLLSRLTCNHKYICQQSIFSFIWFVIWLNSAIWQFYIHCWLLT